MKLGERRSLRTLAWRWGGIVLVLWGIGGLAVNRYYKEVYAVSPEQWVDSPMGKTIRVVGRVKAGTFHKSEEGGTFELSGTSGISLAARYAGKPDENLRELKSIVIEGEWKPDRREFEVQRFHLLPHTGFVMMAYLVSFFSLGFFLFSMERRVLLLSIQIKETRGPLPHL